MAAISSATSSTGAAAWQQLQRQQAQRAADQAERDADVLKDKARAAETKASQAKEDARTVNVEADQADGRARAARSGLSALQQQEERATQPAGPYGLKSDHALTTALVRTTQVKSSSTVNAEGQAVGRVVNTTA